MEFGMSCRIKPKEKYVRISTPGVYCKTPDSQGDRVCIANALRTVHVPAAAKQTYAAN